MVQAEAEAVMAKAAFPAALARAHPGVEARLLLPDPDDVHVLAVAIGAHADCIVTYNARDFPRHTLAEEGITRRDPDGFLWELHSFHPDTLRGVVLAVHATAERMLGQEIALKSLLKRAQLNRLAKALSG
jgi:hypothetical protein